MSDSTGDSIWPFLEGMNTGRQAREALLAHSQERLARMTNRMLRKFPGVFRWEDVSDVVQNVLVRLDRALQEVSPPTPADFLALASAHIRWELTDMARKHNGPTGINSFYLTPPRNDDSARPAMNPPAPEEDPLGLAVWQEFHERIESLPNGTRSLFQALFYQGMPQAEAAEFLGIPLRTLRRRWQKAREKLMEEFGDGFP